MAEIRVEPKRRNIWPWLLLVGLLAAIVIWVVAQEAGERAAGEEERDRPVPVMPAEVGVPAGATEPVPLPPPLPDTALPSASGVLPPLPPPASDSAILPPQPPPPPPR